MTHTAVVLLWPRPAPLSDADPYLGASYLTLIVQHPDDGGWQELTEATVLDPWGATVMPLLHYVWAPVIEGREAVRGFSACRLWVARRDQETT